MTPQVMALRLDAVRAAKELARGEITRDEAARRVEPYRLAPRQPRRR